jgi:VWFA-related protein
MNLIPFVPVLPVLAVLAFASSTIAAQPSGDPHRFPVESELALLDLLVVDSAGRFVSDLSREEVTLLVDGRRREIRYLELQDSDGPSSAVESARHARLRAGPLVFVLDLNSMDAACLERCREAVQGFLRQTPVPDRPFLLASIDDDLRIHSELTRDADRLIRALDTVGSPRGRMSYVGLVERVSHIFRISFGIRPTQAMDEALSESQSFLMRLRQRSRAASSGLAALADYLRPLPGRKNVVFCSAGYPLDAGVTIYEYMRAFNQYGGRQVYPSHILSAKAAFALADERLDTFEEAIDRLNRARVSVYGIDARGIDTGTFRDSREASTIPRSIVSGRNTDEIVGPTQFPRTLAERSGGSFTTGSNDLAPPVSAASRDSGRHYWIAFEPTRGSRRGSARVEVKLARSDLRPIHRLDLGREGSSGSAEDSLTAAFQFPEFFGDFDIRATTAVRGSTLSVNVEIPTRELVFTEVDGRRVCVVGLYGGLFDDLGRWVDLGRKYAFAREFRLDLDEGRFASLAQMETVSAGAEAEIDLASRTLILIVRQEPSGLLTTYRADLLINSF